MRLTLEVSKSEYESFNRAAFNQGASTEDKEMYDTISRAIESMTVRGQMEGLSLPDTVQIVVE
jgi:hypothetical protein